MNYFLIAGEASGDLHASNLMHALQARDKEARFVGLGGDKMREAGCRLVQDYRNMAFMGVIAVLKNWRKVKENFRKAEEALLQEKPQILILIDYPSFNLRLARFCRKHLPETKIIYYIPPKVWAWKAWRVHKIARLSDKVLGIFPFEPAFFKQYGYTCTYVGNPTMDCIRDYQNTRSIDRAATSPNKQKPTIAILPGSRRSEIAHCLPTMLQAAREVNREGMYQIAVTAAPGVEDAFYETYLRGERLTRDTYNLLAEARAAVVNSGTATLETALIGCPQTAVYYIACSKWLGWLKPLIFRIPYFTLVNIIPHREVIQELIAYRFSQRNIEEELRRLLTDEPYRETMKQGYEEIRRLLGNRPAAEGAADIICSIFDPHTTK